MAKFQRKIALWVTSFGLVAVMAGPLTAASLSNCFITADVGCWSVQPGLTVDDQTIAISWGRIWRWFKRKRGAGTIRTTTGKNVIDCLVTPGVLKDIKEPTKDTRVEVWHKRPLFLWQGGDWQRIEIYAYGENKPIWQQELAPGQTRVKYGESAVPLSTNENAYYWQLIPTEPVNVEEFPRKAFRIMSEDESKQIEQELMQVEEKLERDSASKKKRTKERIKFFQDKKLGTDAMIEIYSDPDRTEKLRSNIQEKDFCNVSDPT